MKNELLLALTLAVAIPATCEQPATYVPEYITPSPLSLWPPYLREHFNRSLIGCGTEIFNISGYAELNRGVITLYINGDTAAVIDEENILRFYKEPEKVMQFLKEHSTNKETIFNIYYRLFKALYEQQRRVSHRRSND